MQHQYVVKTLDQLTTQEYKRCHSLNMRWEGMMQSTLEDFKGSPRATAVMCLDGNRLLGWALLIPHTTGRNWYWDSTRYQRSKSKYITQFYVRVSHRQRGIGTRLMAEIKKLDSTPTVIPHDSTSAAFFASHTVVTSRDRRGLLASAKKGKMKAS